MTYSAHVVKINPFTRQIVLKHLGGSPTKERLLDLAHTFAGTNNQSVLIASRTGHTITSVDVVGDAIDTGIPDKAGFNIMLRPALMVSGWHMHPHVRNLEVSDEYASNAWIPAADFASLSFPLTFASTTFKES